MKDVSLETKEEKMEKGLKPYTREEVMSASLEYFDGDVLRILLVSLGFIFYGCNRDNYCVRY